VPHWVGSGLARDSSNSPLAKEALP